jgi:hypothetical protein
MLPRSNFLIALLACIALKVHASPVHLPSMSVRGGARAKVADTMPQPIGPIQVFLNTIKESKRHLAAAAVARSVSIYGMFPVGETFPKFDILTWNDSSSHFFMKLM